MTGAMTSSLREEVELFLIHEAELLDTLRFHDWYALLADDLHYVIPAAESVQGTNHRFDELDPDAPRFHLMDETKATMWLRIRQLDTGMRHVEVPASSTERLITNVTAGELPDQTVAATSKFLVVQIRHGVHQSMFTGRRSDRLRRTEDGFQLVSRRVEFTQTVLSRALSIFF